MKPIEPSPDGTPPLPFLTPSPEPVADVFEADPFFNPPESLPSLADEPPSTEMPFDPDPPVVTPARDAPHTAEERLLETIVSQGADPDMRHTPDGSDELRSLKTRLAALETELTAAREGLAQAIQSRNQTELRFAQAEKQWTDKLNHLRHMLDEVEDTRDEVFQKRVPKLLFIGTLVAGLVATLFAYLIGTGQSTPPPAEKTTPPLETAREFPPSAPVVIPEPPAIAPPVAPLLQVPAIEAPPVSVPRPPPTVRVPVKPVSWPALSGSRWNTVPSAKELKVVFHYGTFTRGTELSSTARQDLKTIASRLQGQPFRIEVEGHTDLTRVIKTKGIGKDNQAIGLARAKTVARFLIDSCGLPAAVVSTSSAGETNPPYPNTSTASQAKNRTVILKISAR